MAGSRKKDPAAPKRPLSAYNIFFRDQKNMLAAQPERHGGKRSFEELGRCVVVWRCDACAWLKGKGGMLPVWIG